MLDLSVTFHIIDHSILLESSVSGFGVGGTAFKWFTSYLSQRTQQRTQVQNKWILSEKKQLSTGVPQGSCLDPVLFIIYVAKFYLSFRPIHSTNQTALVAAIDNCVEELGCWMISNMQMVNDIKAEFLIAGSKYQLECVNIPFIHVGEDHTHKSLPKSLLSYP